MFFRYPCIAVSFFSRFVRITTVIVRLRKGVRKQRDGKQRRVKIQSIIQYFQRGWQATKTGNPQNQRIDGWYDNTRREFSPISFVRFRSASRARQTRRERNPSRHHHRYTPFVFFLLLLLLLLATPLPPFSSGRAFICPPSFCTSNAISAVNAGCARRRGIIMAARALARLMRSGKIRPSVCARPSDAC